MELVHARRGRRGGLAREPPGARRREGHAGAEPLVAVRRLRQHQRAPHELGAAPGEQEEPHAREVGLGRCHERERILELRGEEPRHPTRESGEERPWHGSAHDGLRHRERCRERSAGSRRVGELQHARDVERLLLEQQTEVEPLHEREHEAVLERGVERELEQQVLDRRPGAQLASSQAAPLPEALGVERKQAGRRGDAPVQLDDPAPRGIAKRPRVIAAHHLDEARLPERRRGFGEALERQQVHVRHRPLRFDAVDGLGEHGALHRKRADALHGQELEAARGETDLREAAHQERPPLGDEHWLRLAGPARPLPLERGEQQRPETLLAGGPDHRLRRNVHRQGRERARDDPLAHVGPRF